MAQKKQPANDDISQIIAGYMNRLDAGETIDKQQFLDEYPHLRSDLEQYLEDVNLVENLAGPTATDQSMPVIKEQDRETYTFKESVDTGSMVKKAKTENDDTLQGTFGRYKIEKILGEGAMGAVYLATDTELHRKVALKIPKIKDDGMQEELLERFYREARSAATLRHRGICPVYDVGMIEGQHYIAMAYISGAPLSDYVKLGKKLSLRNIAMVVRKISMALEAAHKQGIVHRDLKPANIMVDEDKEPVVMDFGLAHQAQNEDASRLTTAGTIMGSPAYMSPEQVSGDIDTIGSQSDIYNLGVILYELLTGQVPFKGTVMAIIGQIISEEPKKPSSFRDDVDADLEAICQKMMAKKTDVRYQSAQELTKALTNYLKQQKKKKRPSTGEKNVEPDETINQPTASFPVLNEEPLQTLPPKRKPSKKKKGGKQPLTLLQKVKNIPPRTKMIAVAVFVTGLLLAGIVLTFRSSAGTVVVKLDKGVRDDVKIKVTGNGKVLIADKNNNWKIDVDAGEYQVEIEGGNDQFNLDKDKVTIVRNETEIVQVMITKTVAGNKTSTTKTDYDHLATGKWVDVFKDHPPNTDNRGEKVKFKDGVLELNRTTVTFRKVTGRNMIIRARVKYVTPDEIGFLSLRGTGPESYSAGIKSKDALIFGWIDSKIHVLKKTPSHRAASATDKEGFIDVVFATIDDRLSYYMNGKKIIEATDALIAKGSPGMGSVRGHGFYKDVQVMLLDNMGTPAGVSPKIWWKNITATPFPMQKTSPFDKLSRNQIDAGELKAAGATSAMPELVGILGDSRFYHSRPISRITFSSDSQIMLTSTDQELAWWSLKDGRTTETLAGSNGQLAGTKPQIVVFTERGNKLVIRETADSKIRFTITVPQKWTTMAVATDGKTILTGFADGSISVWSTESGKAVQNIAYSGKNKKGAAVQSIIVSPDGKWFASTYAKEPGVTIWNMKTWKSMQTILVQSVGVMAVSADSKFLATANGKSAEIWNVQTAKKVHTPPHNDTIKGMSFSSNGKLLATVSTDAITIWNMTDGVLKKKISAKHLNGSIAFTPDSKQVVAGMSQFYLAGFGHAKIGFWDVATGKEANTRNSSVALVNDVHVSDDGTLISIAADGSLIKWNIAQREPKRITRIPQPGIIGSSFNADGTIAAVGRLGKLTLWNVTKDAEITTYNGHYYNPALIRLRNDAAVAITMGDFGKRSLTDINGKKIRFDFKGNDAIFTPDGKTLVVIGREGVYGQDVTTGEILATIPSSQVSRKVAFTPDGKFFIVARPDGSIQVRTTATMSVVQKLGGTTNPILKFAFTRDSRLMAALTKTAITIWDLTKPNGKPEKVITLGTPMNPPSWQGIGNNLAFKFTPEGRHLLLGRVEGTIQIFRVGSVPKVVTKKMNDYDNIATGKWVDVFKKYPPRNIGRTKNYKDGLLIISKGQHNFPQVKGKNIFLRGKIEYRPNSIAALKLRVKDNKNYYGVSMNTQGNSKLFFSIGDISEVKGQKQWHELKSYTVAKEKLMLDDDGYVDVTLATIGTQLTLYINGKKQIEITDDKFKEGYIGLETSQGGAQFKNVQVMILDAVGSTAINRNDDEFNRIVFNTIRGLFSKKKVGLVSKPQVKHQAEWIPWGEKHNLGSQQLKPGTIWLFKNHAGNYGKMQIIESGQDLKFRFVTYDKDGKILTQDNNALLKGTHSYSLDNQPAAGRDLLWVRHGGKGVLVPKGNTLLTPYTHSSSAQIDFDRKAAKWVLSLGGKVTTTDGMITSLLKLPKQPFKITDIYLTTHKNFKAKDLGQLAQLANLKSLHIENAGIKESEFVHLKGLQQLETLTLERSRRQNKRITAVGLEHITALKNLNELHLMFVAVTDADIVPLKKMTNLQILRLSEAKITNKGLLPLLEMTNLTQLGLYGTSISDEGLKTIGKMKKLNALYLQKTKVTDAGLKHLKDLKGLQNLWLTSTAVTPEGIVNFNNTILPDCTVLQR